MSSLKRTLKFLLDENVRRDLAKFLNTKGIDVKLVPKSAVDREVAAISFEEGRVLVTNDQDFCMYGETEIYSVVWLRIPQSDRDPLLKVFSRLMDSRVDFSGRIVVLKPGGWDEFPLGKIEEL